MAEDGEGSSDNSEFDDTNDDVFGDKSMMAEKDPSKLIDLELVKLLKFCNTLKNDNQNKEEYQDELMMKGLSIGKKSGDKTLILDMDETMIAAQFSGKETKDFVPTFNFNFSDTNIRVRVRPFCTEMLEKLSQFYEIIAWTAGVKDYADPILDYIDPEKKFFKMRLYRDTCIKVDQFYIKDLDVILDRTKESMVIVDNSILSFSFDL
jgi:carboxy-terminal domain RNA polymerase II polypeptide A small phosphatase